MAAYRCLAALAARDWAAREMCHPQLLAALLNPGTEACKRGAEWRHSAVCALAATCSDVLAGGLGASGPFRELLADAAPRVQHAAAAGPFGAAGRVDEPSVVVATMHT